MVGYKIIRNCFNSFFTGVVSVKKQLDRETLSRYELEVIARDNGKPSLSNSTKASITVLDINDNKPEFDNSTLIGQVYENRPVGSSVCTVVASDMDVGINSKLTFSLNSNDAFTIDPATGEVRIFIAFQSKIVCRAVVKMILWRLGVVRIEYRAARWGVTSSNRVWYLTLSRCEFELRVVVQSTLFNTLIAGSMGYL